MTSRIVFLLGLSRSRRRSATVTSSQPDASRAASIASSLVYLPVPRKRRERSCTPATTSGSVCVRVCTEPSLRANGPPRPSGRFAATSPQPWGGVPGPPGYHAPPAASRPPPHYRGEEFRGLRATTPLRPLR